MTYIHKQLQNGRWSKLNLASQMANIGAEVGRAIVWRKKNEEYSKPAFFRALELLEFTIADPKNIKRLKELTRLYEVMVDYFMGENEYGSSDKLWDGYFLPFNFMARTKMTKS